MKKKVRQIARVVSCFRFGHTYSSLPTLSTADSLAYFSIGYRLPCACITVTALRDIIFICVRKPSVMWKTCSRRSCLGHLRYLPATIRASINKVNICIFHYYILLCYFFHLFILFHFVEPSPADCEYRILSGMSIWKWAKIKTDGSDSIRLAVAHIRTVPAETHLKKIYFRFVWQWADVFFILYFSRTYRQHSASIHGNQN